MEFHFTNKLEEYYQKFVELQEKLRKSEEQRFHLEMKFNEMVQIGRQEQQEHYRKLRAQYKRFLDEDKKRQERNERILRNLERVETRISMLSAKTERIDLLRRQYRNYLIRITAKTPEASKWKTVKEEPRKDLLECELALPSSTETQTNQEQMKILDRYLENISNTDLLKKKTTNIHYNSNKASAIAEDIMNSIYSRHYNKEMPKVKESGDTTQEIVNTEKPPEADSKQSEGDYNLSVDFQPLESVDERPSRGDVEPAFVSALDIAVQPKSEETLSEDGAEPNLAEVSETKPTNQVEVSTIYYNQEYQPSETQIDNSEGREEVENCNLQVESTVNFEESGSKEQVVEQDESFILPVESTENSEVVQPDESEIVDQKNAEMENVPVESTTNSEVESRVVENLPEPNNQENHLTEPYYQSDLTYADHVIHQKNAELENVPVEGTTNSEVEQPSVVENLSEPINQENHPTDEPYYQSDLTYAEQYDQQQGYDQYGQPLVYNQQGQIVQPQFDENGQMLPQYDENGQLIMLYDHEGRAYFEETQPAYEDYGYGDQDGADDQSYHQNYEQQNNEIISEHKVEQFDQQQDAENTNIEQEEVVEKQEEVEQSPDEGIKAVSEGKLGNVMDILDTDTEASSKQNTSKVSNDTDFDFS